MLRLESELEVEMKGWLRKGILNENEHVEKGEFGMGKRYFSASLFCCLAKNIVFERLRMRV